MSSKADLEQYLRAYVQRLEELPFLMQRHVTQLKDVVLTSATASSAELSEDGLDQLLLQEHPQSQPQIQAALQDLLAAQHQRTAVARDLRQHTAQAVSALDHTLRQWCRLMPSKVTARKSYVVSAKQLVSPHLGFATNSSSNAVSQRASRRHQSDKRHAEGDEKTKPSSSIASVKNKQLRAMKKQERKEQKRRQREQRRNRPRRSRIVSDDEDEEGDEQGDGMAVEHEMGRPASEYEKGHERANEDEEEDLPDVICSCRKPPHGAMIACDNGRQCPIEWFHLKCVGMAKAPPADAPWLCPRCRPPGSDDDHT